MEVLGFGKLGWCSPLKFGDCTIRSWMTFGGGVAPNPVELQQKGNIKRHSIPLKAWLVRSGSKLTVLINHLGAGKSHCAESYDKQK